MPADHPCVQSGLFLPVVGPDGGTICASCGLPFVTVGHSQFHPDSPTLAFALTEDDGREGRFIGV
jgi:hypothetical protein